MKKITKKGIIIILIVILLGSVVVQSSYIKNKNFNYEKVTYNNYKYNQSQIKLYFSFEEPKIIEKIINNKKFSSIKLQDLPYSRIPGKPLLPVKTIDILLPPNSIVKKINTDEEMIELKENYLIEPSGQLVSIDEINNINFEDICINHSVYNSENIFPEKIYEIAGLGKFRGYSILTINLNPIKYKPKESKLYYCSIINLTIDTKIENEDKNTCRELLEDKELIRKLVANPSMVDEYTSSDSPIVNCQSNTVSYKYIIITNEKLKKTFQILMNHKSQYTTAAIYTVEEIINNQEYWVNGTWGDNNPANPYYDTNNPMPNDIYEMFNDTQAKIRNFIRYAHIELKTDYVLLGGDVEIVPHRVFYCGPRIDFDTGRPRYDYIPADLYYGTLDWTWNRNYNEQFGEQEEDADFFAEVYIGRAPVSKEYGTRVYINKVKHFETNTKPTDVTLHQSFIRTPNLPKTIKIPEECEKWIPENFSIHRLYQEYGDISLQDWFNSFNDGRLIIQHVGNGAPTMYCINWMNWLDVWWDIQTTQSLRNNFYPIHTSLACNSGKFDQECLAETFLTIDSGGASACIFNSREGIVTHYDAHAYSGEFMERQFYEIFQNETVSLGEVNQLAKQYFHGLAYSDPGYRWCYYTINLLGDPETPVLKTRVKYQNETHVNKEFNSSTPGWGESCFDNIQDAIDATEAGGIVDVSIGIYYEIISINKPITLTSNEKYKATIDGKGIGNVITINKSLITIEGFNIFNSSIDGSGIFVESIENNSICYISNNYISNCGTGIFVNNYNSLDILGCNIINNRVWGLIIKNSKDNFISNCNFSNNQLGGIFLHKTYNSRVKYCNIKENDIGIKIGENLNNDCIYENDYDVFKIARNNFINNKVDAFFINNLCHEWDNNYWVNPRFLPKPIFGVIKNKGSLIIPIPKLKFDYYPWKQPNIV